MKLIVGLGNPGEKYQGTRHNVGFMVVETLASQLSISDFQSSKKLQAETCKSDEIVLAKPQTFMNRSGEAVQRLAQYYKVKPEDIFVVHDDLDITLGEYKLSLRGPKVHNGVTSVKQHIGNDFVKVRVGVDNRSGDERSIPGQNYVLSRFEGEEREVVERVVDEVVGELVHRLR